MSNTQTDDFLDSDAFAAPAVTDAVNAGVSRRWRVPAAAATAGWLVAGVVAGGVAMAAWHTHSSAQTATGTPAVAGGQLPGRGAGSANGFAGGGGGFRGGPGAFGVGPGGGVSGEQHLTGTLRAVNGSSFALTTATGTTTYTIDASTTLVKDGQRVSSLAAMSKGDTVVVHVYPLNGTTHVELVLDGAPGGGTGTTTAG